MDFNFFLKIFFCIKKSCCCFFVFGILLLYNLKIVLNFDNEKFSVVILLLRVTFFYKYYVYSVFHGLTSYFLGTLSYYTVFFLDLLPVFFDSCLKCCLLHVIRVFL